MTFILPVASKEKCPNEERTLDQPRKCSMFMITTYLIFLLVLFVLTWFVLLPLISRYYIADKVQCPTKNIHKRSLDELWKSPNFYGQNLTKLRKITGVVIKKEIEMQYPIPLRIRRGVKQENDSFHGMIQLHPVARTQPDKRQRRMVRILRNPLMDSDLNSSFPWSAVANTQHDERQTRMGRVGGNALMGAVFVHPSFPGSSIANTQHDERQSRMGLVDGNALMGAVNASFPGSANTSELGGDAQPPRMILNIGRVFFAVANKHDMKEPSLLRIRRDTKKSKEKKDDDYEPFVVTDSSPCKPPTGLKTAEVLCKIWPSYTICISYCAYGKTFDEGIKRVHSCTHNENRWSKNFEECKPFVDCKLRLIAPGNLHCKGNEVSDNPICTVSCERYEDQDETKSQTYRCKADGSWQPKLPVCVAPIGTPLVRTPEVKEHVNIAYPGALKKT